MASRFVTSASVVGTLPDLGLVEVAFAGRSNVGKSSLLGKVLRRSSLVRTSRTPGRTQLLNLFVLDEKLALVDLPGFGYAKLSKVQRATLEKMVSDYLRRRETLRGVVHLVDARREPVQPTDRSFSLWLREAGVPVLTVLTKIDLVPKNRRVDRARRIEKGLDVPAETTLLFSAVTGEGRDELVGRLLELQP